MALLDHHRQHLLDSALSEDVIAARGYASIENYYTWHKLRYGEAPNKRQVDANKIPFPSLSIPLYRPGQTEPAVYVARPDSPRIDRSGKKVKYEYPRGVGNVLDVLPPYHSLTTDTNKAVWLTEGAKKADALASLYGYTILPINENGVWGWRSKGKVVDDITKIVWEGRTIVLAPDGDVRHNDNVHRAVKRTSRLLIAHGARQVLILLLPCEVGATTGVDDYIADGHTMSELESHLVTLESVSNVAKVPLMNHPETGAKLFLPQDYDVQGKTLVKRGKGPFYSGVISVTALGRDVHTVEEYASILFNGRGQHGESVLARTVIASADGCRSLAGKGAAVHSRNASELSCYLVEFIQENYDALPQREYTDRYGITPDGGLVVPSGNIGSEVVYVGKEIPHGDNHEIYRDVLQEIETWSETRSLWLLLSLSLASPVITRLQLDRNPTLYLGGMSGSGKTTLIDFCLGAWGDPRSSTIQCGSASSTKIGINQAMTRARGMPLFFEDVHAMLQDRHEAKKVMGNIYDYANRQGRFIGSLDGKGRGGDSIGGVLFLAGEMLPEFQYAGQQRRMMVLDTANWAPLGVQPRSAEGRKRAETLKLASAGYGTLGYAIGKRIWDEWDDLLYNYYQFREDSRLKNTYAWGDIFAAAASTMVFVCDYAGIGKDYNMPLALMRDWAKMYHQSLTQTDPAQEYFERIVMMLSQSKGESDGVWQWLEYDRKLVAGKPVSEKHWRVLTKTPEFERIVGNGIVAQFGQKWQEKNLVTPHKNGKISAQGRILNIKGSCLLIDERHVFSFSDSGDVCENG